MSFFLIFLATDNDVLGVLNKMGRAPGTGGTKDVGTSASGLKRKGGNVEMVIRIFLHPYPYPYLIWISVSVSDCNMVLKWIYPNSFFLIFLYPIPHPYSNKNENIGNY